MATQLTDMKITSVDLVEAGANQQANIEIVKGKDMSENFTTEALDSLIEKKIKEILKTEEVETVETEVEEVQEVETEVTEPQEESTEVEKAIKDANSEIIKMAQTIDLVKAQNAELNKQLDLYKFEKIAKKYEPIGHNPEELAKTLYMYDALGKDPYNLYVKELDRLLELQEQSGIFKEYGVRTSGDSSQLTELFKGYETEGIPNAQWYEKAAIEHPELLNEYDRAYRGK